VEEWRKQVVALKEKLRYSETENRDLQNEFENEKQEILNDARDATREARLFLQVLENFISSHQIDQIIERSHFIEKEDRWHIPSSCLQGKLPTFEIAPPKKEEEKEKKKEIRTKKSSKWNIVKDKVVPSLNFLTTISDEEEKKKGSQNESIAQMQARIQSVQGMVDRVVNRSNASRRSIKVSPLEHKAMLEQVSQPEVLTPAVDLSHRRSEIHHLDHHADMHPIPHHEPPLVDHAEAMNIETLAVDPSHRKSEMAHLDRTFVPKPPKNKRASEVDISHKKSEVTHLEHRSKGHRKSILEQTDVDLMHKKNEVDHLEHQSKRGPRKSVVAKANVDMTHKNSEVNHLEHQSKRRPRKSILEETNVDLSHRSPQLRSLAASAHEIGEDKALDHSLHRSSIQKGAHVGDTLQAPDLRPVQNRKVAVLKQHKQLTPVTPKGKKPLKNVVQRGQNSKLNPIKFV
jgi:hypothetical protein